MRNRTLLAAFNADLDPTFHFDADPDPSFQIKAQNLEKVLKLADIPYILAYHVQIDADPDPYPAGADPNPVDHFDADSDPNPTFQFEADTCGSESTTLSKRPILRL
jgi:hypothetical protein